MINGKVYLKSYMKLATIIIKIIFMIYRTTFIGSSYCFRRIYMHKDLVKVSDLLRSAANIIGKFLELEMKEAQGKNVEKELKSIMGKFMFKILELQALGEKV